MGQFRPLHDSKNSGAITINFPNTGAQFTIVHYNWSPCNFLTWVCYPSSEDWVCDRRVTWWPQKHTQVKIHSTAVWIITLSILFNLSTFFLLWIHYVLLIFPSMLLQKRNCFSLIISIKGSANLRWASMNSRPAFECHVAPWVDHIGDLSSF